ncbi:CBU_0592 family membrane protein [Streptomyces europaeiscabiei]|uniref:CBU_0592 family membrane protein n=1 Tax=Streptomyces europaeiscabiei TaxID=146819 RepID=UPI0038F81729
MASTERIPGGARAFQLLNLFGGAALTVSSGYHQAWPSALLNTAWIGIGLAALTRRMRRVCVTACVVSRIPHRTPRGIMIVDRGKGIRWLAAPTRLAWGRLSRATCC